MIRVILFLVLVGFAAFGVSWLADQNGNMVLVFGDYRIERTLPELALTLIILVAALMLVWTVLHGLWRLPRRLKQAHHAKRQARGRRAVTQGLLAIGAGDHRAARRHAQLARRHAGDDPLTLLLNAQEAQLTGDRAGAERAFEAMASREDTRMLGLRGLFVEAQRSDDPVRAVAIAEATLKSAPNSAWASQAVLGFRCAQGDWAGALAILSSNHQAGLIDAQAFRRERAVLLTAQALELETSERDRARDIVNEAVKLAPSLVPAATLAAKFLTEAHQVRKAMRMLEVAWRTNPHPDLADAYAHVRLGDAARERLVRIESLAKMTPDGEEASREAALAIASAAVDARQFDRARSALAPFITSPTKRVAMLMAEIERGDAGDGGRAREWTLRAVHARHDPAWTADGYVSDRWRPVSPVTGRLDAFRWTTPVAALPSDRIAMEAAAAQTIPPALAKPSDDVPAASEPVAAPPAPELDKSQKPVEPPVMPPAEVSPPADISPPRPAAAATSPSQTGSQAASDGTAPVPPLFRPRRDLGRDIDRTRASLAVPAIIPMVRAPDDPGVDDEEVAAEADIREGDGQEGGLKGFLSRMRR